MSAWLAALAVGVVFAFVQYGWRRTHGGGVPVLAALLRVVAVTLLVALLLDAPVAPARPLAPWVALDVSLSMTRGDMTRGDMTRGDMTRGDMTRGDGALWPAALDSVRSIGAESVFVFGDSARPISPRVRAADLASALRPAIDRAVASGHPLIVITDGEVDDQGSTASLPSGSRIVVLARHLAPDAAVASIEAPRAVVSGDTVAITVSVVAGAAGVSSGALSLALDGRAIAAATLGSLPPFSERGIELRVPIAGAAGPAVLSAAVAVPGDVESRNDTASVAIDRSPAASAVFVSTAPDPDARYAIAVLRGALAIPTRGYFRVAPNAWRIDGALTPVSEGDVRSALHSAPIAVIHGDTAIFGPTRGATTGSVALIVPARDTLGEWYVQGSPDSPLAGALAGVPWDSLAPISAGGAEPQGSWRGLEARRGRGGVPRAIIVGSESPRRVVIVAASGLWRWRVRGGASVDAFTATWGSVFDWLAAERGDRRAAMPDAASFRAEQPIRWRRGSPSDSVVPVMLRRRNGSSGNDSLTLHFGAGANIVMSPPLAPGIYDVTTRGGASIVVVNPATELIPRAPTVRSRTPRGPESAGPRRRTRDLPLLYVLVVLTLCAEWIVRRRIGMR